MPFPLDAALLVREARSRAGLSQRDLALRADTSQSVVARIEAGQTQPGSDTLGRLLEAAGFELVTELAPLPVIDTHMLEDVARILALTPEQRLREVGNVSRFESAARRA
jgi:predicted transcriptional regulator